MIVSYAPGRLYFACDPSDPRVHVCAGCLPSEFAYLSLGRSVAPTLCRLCKAPRGATCIVRTSLVTALREAILG